MTAQLPALDFTCITNHGAITITGYTGPGRVVIMPRTINGLPVTGIGGRAFSDCTNLTNLNIPNSITNIGRGALQAFSGRIEVYQVATTGSQGAEPGTNVWTERVMLPLAKGKWGQTQVLYEHTNKPGPWSRGNCMFFEANSAELEGRPVGLADVVHWRIFNIHAENFHEITRRLGLTSVEAEVIHKGLFPQVLIPAGGQEMTQLEDGGDCIITDPRIPKDWLRSTPCVCYSKADWRQYLASYPDKLNVAK